MFNFSRSLHNINDWTIQLGITRRHSHSYYGQKVKVQRVIPHPQYNLEIIHDNDIALFQLATRVAFHEHLLPVCLPPPDITELEPGTMCTVIGWGKKEDKKGKFIWSRTSSIDDPFKKKCVVCSKCILWANRQWGPSSGVESRFVQRMVGSTECNSGYDLCWILRGRQRCVSGEPWRKTTRKANILKLTLQFGSRATAVVHYCAVIQTIVNGTLWLASFRGASNVQTPNCQGFMPMSQSISHGFYKTCKIIQMSRWAIQTRMLARNLWQNINSN